MAEEAAPAPGGPGHLMPRDLVATRQGLLQVVGVVAPNRYSCLPASAGAGDVPAIDISDAEVLALYRPTWKREW